MFRFCHLLFNFWHIHEHTANVLNLLFIIILKQFYIFCGLVTFSFPDDIGCSECTGQLSEYPMGLLLLSSGEALLAWLPKNIQNYSLSHVFVHMAFKFIFWKHLWQWGLTICTHAEGESISKENWSKKWINKYRKKFALFATSLVWVLITGVWERQHSTSKKTFFPV